jgi:hypothetical protein
MSSVGGLDRDESKAPVTRLGQWSVICRERDSQKISAAFAATLPKRIARSNSTGKMQVPRKFSSPE